MNNNEFHRSQQRVKAALRLNLVMGSPNCPGQDPAFVLEEAIRGGVTIFQFREKGTAALQGEAKLELGLRLRRICDKYGVPFLVNDEAELALALGADGIHIGQEDEAAAQVRSRFPNKMMGVSAHNLEEASAALAAGADYIGVGPQYPTRTKPDAGAVTGPAMITHIRAGGLKMPIVGIGGIEAGNARHVMQAGADGIAVISSITSAASPREAAAALRRSIDEVLDMP
jgi:thiamine-phosphate pyrophosphorylase